MSSFDKIFEASQRKCGACGETGHNARTCKSKSVPFSTGGLWNEKTFDGLEQLGLPFVDASHVAMISKIVDGEVLKEPNARVQIPRITWKEEPITMTWGELDKKCKTQDLVSIGESTYSGAYLRSALAYLPKNTVLNLYTDYHFPLKATFEYGGEEWIFFLAPRVAGMYAENIKDWSEQEMKSHGKDVSFKDFIKKEIKSHGNIDLVDWAKHEEKSHKERYGAEIESNTLDNKTHQKKYMAQDKTGYEIPTDDNGSFYMQVRGDKETIQKAFKDWKPKAYPYEKRITQDSLNITCENCGEENVHYQFYLPQKNSRYTRMRFVDGATHCKYDEGNCGANLCSDCANDNDCENCGAEMCSTCADESEYTDNAKICIPCREADEMNAETFGAETKMEGGVYKTTCDCGTVLTWDVGMFNTKDKDGNRVKSEPLEVERLEFPSPQFDHFEEELSIKCPTCGEYHTCEIEAPVYHDRLEVNFGAETGQKKKGYTDDEMIQAQYPNEFLRQKFGDYTDERMEQVGIYRNLFLGLSALDNDTLEMLEDVIYFDPEPNMGEKMKQTIQTAREYRNIYYKVYKQYPPAYSSKNYYGAETEMERYNKHRDEILEVKAKLLQENEEGELYIDDPDQEAENDAIYEVLSKYYPEFYDAESFGAEYMRKGWKIKRPFEDSIQATKENPYRSISIIYNEGDYEPYLIYRTTGSGEYYFKTLDEALDWLNGDNEIYEGGKDFRNAESDDYLEGVEKGIPIADIDWETDGEDSEEMGLPSSVRVPSDLEEDEIADYLSDEYGFLVNGFVVMGAETFEADTPDPINPEYIEDAVQNLPKEQYLKFCDYFEINPNDEKELSQFLQKNRNDSNVLMKLDVLNLDAWYDSRYRLPQASFFGVDAEEFGAETFETQYAGVGSLMDIGKGTSIGSFSPEELTESSAIHGDFDSASLNYSGNQNIVSRAEGENMTESEESNFGSVGEGNNFGQMRAEEPVIEEPDFIPDGDGRALGQQTSSINLSPLHAENSTYQEVMGMIEDLSDDDYMDFCYEMDIDPEDMEELSSFVMRNYDSNRVMGFLKDRGMVEGYHAESKVLSKTNLVIAGVIGLGLWKGKQILDTAKSSLKQSAENKKKGCSTCNSNGTVRKNHTQVKQSEYSVNQINPVEAEGQSDIHGAEGVTNPRHAPSSQPFGYPSKSLKMW